MRRSSGFLESANKSEVLRAVLRHKLLVAGVLVLGMAVSAFYTASLPIEYRSTSSVLIENYAPNMMAIAADTFSYTQDVTKAQRVLATTRPVIGRTEELAGLPPGTLTGSPDNAMPGGFDTRVDGQLLYLQVIDRDRNRAALLANKWSDAFVDEMRRRAQAPKVQLETNINEKRQAWIKAFQALRDFERDMNFDPREFEQPQHPVRKSYEELGSRLDALNLELIRLNSEKGTGEEASVLHSVRAKNDPVIKGFLDEVQARRTRLLDVREKLRAGTLEVKEAEQSLADAQAALKTASQQLNRQIEVELNRAKSEHAQVLALHKVVEAEFLALQSKSQEHKKLSRDDKNADRQYTETLQAKGQTDMTRLYESNARAWEQAEASTRPFRPNWNKNLVLGFLFSIALAVAFAFLLERMDDTVRTTKELERHLGVTTLGMIPVFERTLADEDGYLLAQRQASSTVVDSLRNIHIGLEVTHGTHRTGQPLVLTITSAAPNEGKSFLASNLATLFAGLGRRVLVVDADLRKGSLTKAFKCARDVGLRETIATGVWAPEHIVNGITPGYHLLPVGKNSYDNPESLNPEGFRKVLEQMKKGFDVIIFDTPPVLAVADACVIGPCCDVTVLVSRSRHTRLGQVERAAAVLYAANVKQVQFVVNGVDAADAASDAYGYGYGYGYNYGYGYGYGYGMDKKRRGERQKNLPAPETDAEADAEAEEPVDEA